jgi:hypothetical protein
VLGSTLVRQQRRSAVSAFDGLILDLLPAKRTIFHSIPREYDFADPADKLSGAAF